MPAIDEGALVNKMNMTLDGDFQKYIVESGAYIRDHFFDDPRLKKMVEHLSDDDLKRLRRGGHDYRKLHAAYATAVELKDAPVVILAKTVKGWALGGAIEGRNVTHQAKKLSEEELERFAARLDLPIDEKDIEEGTAPYYHPGPESDEVQYMLERRRVLGGFLPRAPVHREAAASRQGLDLYGVLKGLEAAGRDDDGFRPSSSSAPARQEDRRSGRPDHSRRGAHVRHGVALPRVQDLCGARATVRTGRRRAPSRLQGVASRVRSSRRASPRPARWDRSPRRGRRTQPTASR